MYYTAVFDECKMQLLPDKQYLAQLQLAYTVGDFPLAHLAEPLPRKYSKIIMVSLSLCSGNNGQVSASLVVVKFAK